jgi:hypothetical protein
VLSKERPRSFSRSQRASAQLHIVPLCVALCVRLFRAVQRLSLNCVTHARSPAAAAWRRRSAAAKKAQAPSALAPRRWQQSVPQQPADPTNAWLARDTRAPASSGGVASECDSAMRESSLVRRAHPSYSQDVAKPRSARRWTVLGARKAKQRKQRARGRRMPRVHATSNAAVQGSNSLLAASSLTRALPLRQRPCFAAGAWSARARHHSSSNGLGAR